MANKKRARGKRGKKKKPAKGGNEVVITPAQKRRVLTTLGDLKKDAQDLALGIQGVQDFLCKVDFCSS